MMSEATRQRVAQLASPDVSLVALAGRLADLLDEPETCTAAAAREYRAVMAALTSVDAGSRRSPLDEALDGVEDDG